jgi:tetratricopeptide (TPR) repeat protein
MVRQRLVILAVMGLLITGTGCQDMFDRLRANYAAKQGNDFYKTGDYTKAIEWYRYSTYLNPELGIAYYHAALSYMALYRPGSRHPMDVRYSEEASRNLKRYLLSNPNHQEAKDHLLTVFLQAKKYDEAGTFFEEELRRLGGDDPAWASELMHRLGMIYAKKGDFESSLEWYKKRSEIEETPESLYTIGVLCWDKVYRGAMTVTLDRRRELIEMGLDYLEKAADLRENYFEAVLYINLLYREKAKVARDTGDLEQMTKWNEEANKQQKIALQMRKEVMAKK